MVGGGGGSKPFFTVMGYLAEIKASFGSKQTLKCKVRPVWASGKIYHGSLLPMCKSQQSILNEKKKKKINFGHTLGNP